METLARKLCEAVDNEDAQEVKALLQRGADPNLVLPNGVAAIHLASGRESESALRCLALILQDGGDPNVRSIEELTPIHVAASWGCCKALLALLRKGGDPTLLDQPQDGNSASDLALMEENRRCVVTILEYMERSTDCSEQNPGYRKDNLSVSDGITQISNISLLLESSYDSSPLNSTRMSPLTLFTKGLDNAIIRSQVDLPGLDADGDFKNKETPELANERNQIDNSHKILPYFKPSKKSSDCALRSIAQFDTEPQLDTSVNGQIFRDNQMQYAKRDDYTKKKAQMELSVKSKLNRNRDVIVDIQSSSKINDNTISWKMTGMDVTSPDHIFAYSKQTSKDNDLEETLFIQGQNGGDYIGDQDADSSSKYNSCQSDHYSICEENYVGIDARYSLGTKSCNPQLSVLQMTASLPKRSLENRSNVISCSQTFNNHTNGGSPTQNVLCKNQTLLAEQSQEAKEMVLNGQSSTLLVVRGSDDASPERDAMPSKSQIQLNERSLNDTEVLCNDQSSTFLIVRRDDACPRSGHEDLKNQLRHLMLLTKACASNLSQHNTPALKDHAELSDVSTSDTLPVNHQENPQGVERRVINDQLKAMMFSTRLQTRTIDSAIPDTLAMEPHTHVVKEKKDEELSTELMKMMISTKSFPSTSMKAEVKGPSLYNNCKKSHLNSSNSHHSNSSLFHETVEMPQRGRRVRSPGSRAQSPPSNLDTFTKKNIPVNIVSQQMENVGTYELKVPNFQLADSTVQRQTFVNAFRNPDVTVNISDFLTDDLSSTDSEPVKSDPHVCDSTRIPVIEHTGNTWLTEDGEEESSGDVGQGSTVNPLPSTQCGQSFPGTEYSGSLVHSTLLEDLAVNSVRKFNEPRYSFSRLSCITKEGINECQLSTVIDCNARTVPLSPGGRPVNESKFESVEYLYEDCDKGHTFIERHIPCTDTSSNNTTENSDDTILYDWTDYKGNRQAVSKIPTNRVAVELYRLSNSELTRRLLEAGEDRLGPVTSQNRKMYIKLLDKCLKEQQSKGSSGSTGYSPELSLVLRIFNIPDCNCDEATLALEFDQPDKTRKWREGVLKSSFNYLLLDPRVTRNLPSRCQNLSQNECFRTFVSSVFYVGKGKRSRPYSHLYEALTHYKGRNKQMCAKVQHILDIWKSGQGVISLHCFQNTIPVEAYTREACMVDAIGLKMLTNQKKGVYYGQLQNWKPARRRNLGVHMLYRALQIFLAEGERQLRPPDIHSG
ncbi:ankyrin repeat and LEM domain-containing 1, partial [Pelobates cultripes]